MGRRVKRGLFVSKNGIKINADVNGAYNIMKKAIPNAFANGIEGFGVHPSVLTVKKWFSIIFHTLWISLDCQYNLKKNLSVLSLSIKLIFFYKMGAECASTTLQSA